MVTFVLALAVALSPPGESSYEPTANYVQQEVEGWKVYASPKLLLTEQELAEDVLALLCARLYDVNRTVPPGALLELHKVPIWLEVDDRDFPGAVYHPSAEWLKENGYNPDKAKSVEIANARNFLSWSLHQPSMILHELAHAYHHQVLGYDNAEIKAAYKRAVDSKSYESVLRYDGEKARAYALNNDQEYFAELTEAFFGTNDFHPFVRAEIKQHDPEMHSVLRKLWRIEQ